MVRRAYFRGFGLVSAIGSTSADIVSACQAGVSRVGEIALSYADGRSTPYAFIASRNRATPTSSQLYRYLDTVIAAAVADAALTQADVARVAVFVGTTAADISDLEQHYRDDLANGRETFALYRSGFGVLAGYVVDRLGSAGPEYTFSTACSSSANALITAAQMIALGKIDHAIVLGVEEFNCASLYGFDAMMLLAPDACRPFDKRRSGTVLGEGVGALVLSAQPPSFSSQQTQRPFHLVAGANLCDANNAASSSAQMIERVMQQALSRSRLSASDIRAVKAHGTATPSNDAAEAQAMNLVFSSRPPPFVSLKPYVGHTLGACGVIETIVMLNCLQQSFIPATPNFQVEDEECGCQPTVRSTTYASGPVMLNFFGFGGNNASFVIDNSP